MKKKFLLVLVILGLILTGCTKIEENVFTTTVNKGTIGDFSLLSPIDDAETLVVPKFTWEAATNATTYTLEVCSSESFSQTEDDVYIKKTGITTTEYTVSSTLKSKNHTYYWRVTAVNNDTKKLDKNGVETFYYKADDLEEVKFDIEYADEWAVHKEGSQAEVSIDRTDFFNNNENSLKIAFDSEHTNRGIPSSDGWIVITHSKEVELYGVDSLFFNFYYSGQDAEVWVRIVDEDNEYWNAKIQLANNTKQSIVVKFSDFTLRTKGGTTIANQVFDYNHIKYVEFVFEKSFGDGVCYVSDLKAVHFDAYKDMFIDKVNFNDFSETDYINDQYVFDKAISNEGYTLTMSYSGSKNDNNAKGIQGYGFLKVMVNKFLLKGDAIKLKVKYTGNTKTANLLFRVIEEDKDRWVYKECVSNLPEDGEILIPYQAFSLSEYNGNGSREFYFIKQLQFGIEGVYDSGALEWSDIEFVSMAEEVENYHVGSISALGVIDDFNSYVTSTEIYKTWQLSSTNKDELMSINTQYAYPNLDKVVKLTYKTDMGPANYGIVFTGISGFSALSIDLNDTSIKKDDAKYNYLDKATAKLIISLFVSSGEEYRYVIDELNGYWTRYVIPFSEFTLVGVENEDTIPLVSEEIRGLELGFQYYYYLENGKSSPEYSSNNAIYMDNVKLTTDEVKSFVSIPKEVKLSNDNKTSLIEDFSNFDSSKWNNSTSTIDNEKYKISYEANSQTSAIVFTNVSSNVLGKGLRVDMKGDGNSKVDIIIHMIYAGNSYTYKVSLGTISSDFKEYVIGFNKFTKQSGTGSIVLNKDKCASITEIEFKVSGTGEAGSIYIDNIKFDNSVSYDANQINTLED